MKNNLINFYKILTLLGILLVSLINKILSNDFNSFTDLKSNINNFINLFYLYNPHIKSYDYLINSNIYNSNSFIYSNSFEYGVSLSNVPYKYILPNPNEPMSSYNLMYSITNINKNKIKSNIEYILKQNEIIEYEKLIYILDSSYQLKKSFINIYFLNIKKQILQNIIDEFLKLKETISIDYTYNKAKLSDILIIDKEITSLKREINSIDLEINNYIQIINSLIPINNLENKIFNQIQAIQLEKNIHKNIIPQLYNQLYQLYNNPYLIKIQKEKELIYYEIYKEDTSKLPDNKFSIEYSIRPHLDHMLMFKYSIMFENKNISVNKIKALYEKINSLNAEYQSKLLQYKSEYNYIISQLKYIDTLISNIQEEESKQEKYIKSLLIEYTYNKSKLLNIYLAYKELLNIKLQKIELENQRYNILVEFQTLRGEIYYYE